MATFTLEKQSCHNWKITNDDEKTIASVKLYTYLDVLLDDELEFDAQDECNINLEDYEDGDDGVFYVQIYYVLEDEKKIQMRTVCIYDLCDAENCYKALFKYVLCKCNDPCDADCNELYDMETKRQDLELIFALYTTLEQMVYYEKTRYYNIYTVDTSRKSFISQVGRMIEKLGVVVNRCGMCTDETVEDITC